MGVVDDVSLETVVAVFDVWLVLDALNGDTPVTYDFLRRPAVYESLRRPTRKTPRPSTPDGIQVLGPAARDENRFWQQYAQIEPATLGGWDRQEPYRLEIPDRVRVAPVPEAPRIVCQAPEVFVFPSGWSTTLWLRIVDPFALRDLPNALWALEGDPRITVTPAGSGPLTLTGALDALRDRVGGALYGPSLRRRARRIIRQRVVAIISRKGPERDYQYLDEDLLVIYGALEPSEAGMGPLWRMEQSSQRLDDLDIVIRYGRGLFLDNSAGKGDTKQHWRRCNARNLRNMIMMCAVLQATVKFGSLGLPPDAGALAALPAVRQEDIRLLYRLVAGSQRGLRRIPAAFAATSAAFYFGHHKEIQEAVALTLPTL
jgi:hypothetical protein